MAVTVKRNNPTHPYCSNWQFPHGIVLGNGPSRHGLNLPKLRENAAIYGCNALYRDFKPDFLFANDTNMIVEILQSGYRGKCVFFDTPPIPKDQAENLHFYHKDPATGEEKEVPVTEEFGHKELAKEFIYIPRIQGKIHVWLSPDMGNFEFNYTPAQWGTSTGLGALQYALEKGEHKFITVYGFDSHTTGSWNNLYDGTPIYSTDKRRLECKQKNIPYVPITGELWSDVLFKLKAAHPHVEVEMA